MKTSDFYYDLPKELIAQYPSERRELARLLVYNRADGSIEHTVFSEIADYLNPGDALVINDTKVIPARLMGEREGGGKAELLLLRRIDGDGNMWEALCRPAKRLRPGSMLSFGDGRLFARVKQQEGEGICHVEFIYDGIFEEILDAVGRMPLPPYIKQYNSPESYQTVYARENGSAAAPTAGLHFTEELLRDIERKGVKIVRVLLHIGLGTFRPVQEENIEDHKMHSEYYRLTESAAAELNAVKEAGGRVIAVGTTSCRVLETLGKNGRISAGSGYTDIFIMPGYKFQMIDGLITNFHLPESTLLMLISAFMGRDEALRTYKEAIEQKYRFYSFGDAMFIE